MTEDVRKLINLIEAAGRPEMSVWKPSRYSIPYGLAPITSKATLDTHYNKLYKGYVDKYNQGVNVSRNKAGAYLHEKWFEQFRPRRLVNRPSGAILDRVNRHYGSMKDFRDALIDECEKVYGSGWVYVNRNMKIKQIRNHRIPMDGIVVLIDMWEHAWARDYPGNRKAYVQNLWKIFDWTVINARL